MSSNFSEFTQPGKKPVVNSIFDFSAEALGEIRLWLEQNPPAIGISNILGFSQFTAQAAPIIAANETTSSTLFVNLATPGPELSGLPDGKYLVLHGCQLKQDTAGDFAVMALQVNGSGSVEPNIVATNGTAYISGSTANLVTLSKGGNNDLKANYQVQTGGTANFATRWLIAIKYANK